MVSRNQPIIETRRAQAFPTLEPAEIERVRRFGTLRSYKPGEILAQAGKVSEGLIVILSGKVNVARHALSGNGALIVTHVAGSFLANWRNWPAGRRLSMHKPKARSMPWSFRQIDYARC